mmetsp:Transcript_17007/g.50983  ORF Transcript_17007/g.50983 Transcript_17007/m.50983 type:complete len:288 (-) Transcript_17007:1449-2312(-)
MPGRLQRLQHSKQDMQPVPCRHHLRQHRKPHWHRHHGAHFKLQVWSRGRRDVRRLPRGLLPASARRPRVSAMSARHLQPRCGLHKLHQVRRRDRVRHDLAIDRLRCMRRQHLLPHGRSHSMRAGSAWDDVSRRLAVLHGVRARNVPRLWQRHVHCLHRRELCASVWRDRLCAGTRWCRIQLRRPHHHVQVPARRVRSDGFSNLQPLPSRHLHRRAGDAGLHSVPQRHLRQLHRLHILPRMQRRLGLRLAPRRRLPHLGCDDARLLFQRVVHAVPRGLLAAAASAGNV